jgi:DNA-3-methyladenine glycosylase II
MNAVDFAKAQRHLARRDAVLRRLMKTVGACTLRTDADHFGVLARSIVSQQISSKAALSISTRLAKTLGRSGITARAIARTSDEKLRAAGLSSNKLLSLRDLAEKTLGGEVPLKELHSLDDEAVIQALIPVRGIGRWTAEMFLIFSLGRADVLPVADYGLRAGVQRQYELTELPGKEQLQQLAEPWRPYRSIGTWFIWRSFGNVPQST